MVLPVNTYKICAGMLGGGSMWDVQEYYIRNTSTKLKVESHYLLSNY